MSWNYRVLKSGDTYALHEVYYDDDGRISGWLMEPVKLEGFTSLEDMAISLEIMMNDATKGVIELPTETTR